MRAELHQRSGWIARADVIRHELNHHEHSIRAAGRLAIELINASCKVNVAFARCHDCRNELQTERRWGVSAAHERHNAGIKVQEGLEPRRRERTKIGHRECDRERCVGGQTTRSERVQHQSRLAYTTVINRPVTVIIDTVANLRRVRVDVRVVVIAIAIASCEAIAI
jgi:hypothetical protein